MSQTIRSTDGTSPMPPPTTTTTMSHCRVKVCHPIPTNSTSQPVPPTNSGPPQQQFQQKDTKATSDLPRTAMLETCLMETPKSPHTTQLSSETSTALRKADAQLGPRDGLNPNATQNPHVAGERCSQHIGPTTRQCTTIL